MSMQAFLVTVPRQYQLDGKTNPPGELQLMYDKDWGYVLTSEPQTLRQTLTFFNVILVPFNERQAASKEKK